MKVDGNRILGCDPSPLSTDPRMLDHTHTQMGMATAATGSIHVKNRDENEGKDQSPFLA